MFPALVLLRASVFSVRTSVVDHARLLVAFFMMSHLQSYLSNARQFESCKTDFTYATFLNDLLKTLAADLLYASLRFFVCSPNATN